MDAKQQALVLATLRELEDHLEEYSYYAAPSHIVRAIKHLNEILQK